MVLQSGPDDLPGTGQIFSAAGSDHGADQKRIKSASDTECTRGQGELVHPMVCLDGQRISLPRLEVHHLVAAEVGGTFPVVLEHRLTRLREEVQGDPERAVRPLCPGNGGGQQIDRSTRLHQAQLGGEMAQDAGLRRCPELSDQRGQTMQDPLDPPGRGAFRIHADDGVTAAEGQPVQCQQEESLDVVSRLVQLETDAEHACPAH